MGRGSGVVEKALIYVSVYIEQLERMKISTSRTAKIMVKYSKIVTALGRFEWVFCTDSLRSICLILIPDQMELVPVGIRLISKLQSGIQEEARRASANYV